MGRKGGIVTENQSKSIEIGNKYYEYTAVYPPVYGRIPLSIRPYTEMGGHVYSRILAVYGHILGVYRGYTAVYTRYTAVLPDHGTGWVRGMHATLAP